MEIYTPREDSFLLKKVMINYITKNNPKKLLDIGSGSGILANTALNLGVKRVVASDINKKALEKIKLKNPKIVCIYSNLFENINEKFNIIVFNTPYLPMDDDESLLDPIWSGGRAFIDNFLLQSKNFLESKGIVLFTYSSKDPIKTSHIIEDKVTFEDGETVFVGKLIIN